MTYAKAFSEMGADVPGEISAWLEELAASSHRAFTDGIGFDEGLIVETMLQPTADGHDATRLEEVNLAMHTVGAASAAFQLLVDRVVDPIEEPYVQAMVPAEYVPFAYYEQALIFFFVGLNGDRRGVVHFASIEGQNALLISHAHFTRLGTLDEVRAALGQARQARGAW